MSRSAVEAETPALNMAARSIGVLTLDLWEAVVCRKVGAMCGFLLTIRTCVITPSRAELSDDRAGEARPLLPMLEAEANSAPLEGEAGTASP